MSIPDQETVQRILAINERDVRIRGCIETAWSELKENYPDRAWWRRKSTTRGIMWENSVNGVVGALEEDSGIKTVPQNDTVTFIADNTVLFRLKKATTGLFTSNYPTLLAGLFHEHQADLFGPAGHHRVEIVHVFNRFQTALDWIGVVAREKSRVLWQYELPQGGAAVVPLPRPIPTKPASDSVLRPVATTNKTETDEEKK